MIKIKGDHTTKCIGSVLVIKHISISNNTIKLIAQKFGVRNGILIFFTIKSILEIHYLRLTIIIYVLEYSFN